MGMCQWPSAHVLLVGIAVPGMLIVTSRHLSGVVGTYRDGVMGSYVQAWLQLEASSLVGG